MIDAERIKIGVTIVATCTAILFIILTRIIPTYATLFLSIEVILLPSIYIISGIITENLLRKQYSSSLQVLLKESVELNEQYKKLLYKYELLKIEEKKWRIKK